MAVNANSVIELWVNAFDPAFYTALTNQEDYLYTTCLAHDADLQTAAINQMTLLMNAMDAWRTATSTTRQAVTMKGIMSRLVTYQMYRNRFGIDAVPDATFDAKTVFDMGGFVELAKSRASTYYDDMPTSGTHLTNTSPKLTADIALLAPSAYQPLEATAISAIDEAAVEGPRNRNYQAMWEDLAPPTTLPVPMTKTDIANWVFVTLNWKWAKTYITSLGIEVPSFIP